MCVQENAKSSDLSLYLPYPLEGIWYFGVRGLLNQTGRWYINFKMRIRLLGCPNQCSGHGYCKTEFEETSMTFYSFCHCDQTHGGFDCSLELLSRTVERLHLWTLVLSNAAASLPSVWAFHQKAHSEWIIFMFGGIGSALYHSCDAGGWCAFPFHALQFAEFWLAFLAVIATFLYFSPFTTQTKATMHLGAAIILSIITDEGPTRSWNGIFAVSLGFIGLIFGWVIELWRLGFSIRSQQHSSSLSALSLSLSSFKGLCQQLRYVCEGLANKCHCCCIFFGLLMLAAALSSWAFETAETYWLWHSLWHISIYSSSFFFLWSTAPRQVGSSMLKLVIGGTSCTAKVGENGENDIQVAEVELLVANDSQSRSYKGS